MIRNEPRLLTSVDIAQVEAKYNAHYVFESPTRSPAGDWYDTPALIFYCKEAHPRGSNYFALFPRDGNWFISDGISATCAKDGIAAVRADNGDIIYSHWRHDFNTSTDGSVSIDGGRDYTRVMASKLANRSVILEVVDGVLQERNHDNTGQQG